MTGDGSPLPSATVNVSSSGSASRTVVTVPVPLVAPALIVMLDSVPWSPASDVPRVTVSGTVTALPNARDSVARTVTGDPSATGFGAADSDTVTAAGGGGGLSLSRTDRKTGPDAFTFRSPRE